MAAADLTAATYERIAAAFDVCDHVALAYSGSAASAVCLSLTQHVARERGHLPLHVIHVDEELDTERIMPGFIEQDVRSVAQRPGIILDWYCVPIRRHHPPYRIAWAPERCAEWVREMPPEAICALSRYDDSQRLSIPSFFGLLFDPAPWGTVCLITAARSQKRDSLYHATARIERDTSPTSRGNLWTCHPIYDWRTTALTTATRAAQETFR